MAAKTGKSKTIGLKDKVYGTTTVGSRGQVVIPAQARKDLRIKPGDQILVVGKMDKVLGLMKADQIEDLVAMIMDQVEEGISKDQMRQQAQDFIKLLGKNNKHA